MADNDNDLDLVPLFAADEDLSEMEADTLKSLLEANGINVVVVGAEMLPSLPYELRVPAAQLAAARDIITAALDAGSQAAEEGEAASETQP
jgi:hypothetical protein